MHLAKRILNVSQSATLALSNQTKDLKAKGADVIDLSIGQPDFSTPKAIDDAAIAAIQAGNASFYTAATGIPELKQAISDRIFAQDGIRYDHRQIVATTGAKFALYALFQVFLNPGDEVLIPVPYWVSYEEQIKLASGVPHLVMPAVGHKVSVDDLEAARTDKTRALIINSPQNPSGVVYDRTELTLIGNWALKHHILVVTDDIYRDLIYNGTTYTSMISIDPDIAANTVLISGVSKSYAMTGWRIGYAAGPEKLIQAMATFISHTTSNPAAVSEYAAVAALTGDQQVVEKMRRAFEERLNLFYDLLADIPGFDMGDKPQGAFYLFPNIKRAAQLSHYGTVDDFISALLTETGVAIVPGRAFGMPDHARISYCKDLASLKEAARRIREFVGK
ncbi:aminotransferase class I/II-fold pyridoxal phosphate-dependent enzyme [Lactobacillus rhamnosus]|nr:aminotransferase class I/II-fold pyridoxal phosphate-dependent enzyme [Lacticaseibacillus rhamnosus]